MKRLQTKQIKADPNFVGKEVLVAGWVKTVRKQSTFSFVELNDGSQVSNLQVVIESTLKDYEIIMEKI